MGTGEKGDGIMDLVWWFIAGVFSIFIGTIIGKYLDDKESEYKDEWRP